MIRVFKNNDEHASELLLQIAGGQVGPLIEVVNDYLPLQPSIKLRRNLVGKILGVSISDKDIVRMLTLLNMQLEEVEEGWQVTPPLYRFDLQIEVDLVEELARLYGYDNIPATIPRAEMWSKLASATVLPVNRLRNLLV